MKQTEVRRAGTRSYFEVLVYKNGRGAVRIYRGPSQDRAIVVYTKAVNHHPEQPAVILSSRLVRHERVVKAHKMPPRARVHRKREQS